MRALNDRARYTPRVVLSVVYVLFGFCSRGGRASMSMMSVLSEMRKLESFAKHRRRTEYLNYSLLTASATLLLTSQKKSFSNKPLSQKIINHFRKKKK